MARNLTLMTDMYQLTMAQGYFKNGLHNKKAVFNMFYRKNPCGNGYAVFAGLEQVMDYVKDFKFTPEDIAYLFEEGFDPDFLKYLENMKIDLDIEAVKEGSVIFPYEPLIQVAGNIIQAQILETPLLTIVNHQTLIATKASRITAAAKGRKCLEFGLRRAQGADAGIYGARASYIGGFSSTSNVLAGKMFGIPISGTMAHSWVMSFNSELESFRAYAKEFPKNLILLVDTYDTLHAGIPNAIKVFNEMKAADPNFGAEGIFGIRIDSGDLAYLTKKAREMLVAAGFPNAVISVSNDLEETTIASLLDQGAELDVLGVGTKNITSDGCGALGGVYKLVELDGVPKIKVSENIEKITNPGKKTFFRLIDKQNKIIADYISLDSTMGKDHMALNNELVIMDETHSWKQQTLEAHEFNAIQMLQPIMYKGNIVYNFPTLQDIRQYADKQKSLLWPEYLRLVNPPKMKVNLSDSLYDMKKQLLFKAKNN